MYVAPPMGKTLEARVNNAPLPVRFAVKTAATIAFPFAWAGSMVYGPLISLLPEKVSAKLLDAKDAISNTKKTSVLEVGLAVADLGYQMVTGIIFCLRSFLLTFCLMGLGDISVQALASSSFITTSHFFPKEGRSLEALRLWNCQPL